MTQNSNTDISVQEARQVLGPKAINMPDEEIAKLISSYQNLAEGWLDAFEKTIFKGKTLNAILTPKERGQLL